MIVDYLIDITIRRGICLEKCNYPWGHCKHIYVKLLNYVKKHGRKIDWHVDRFGTSCTYTVKIGNKEALVDHIVVKDGNMAYCELYISFTDEELDCRDAVELVEEIAS